MQGIAIRAIKATRAESTSEAEQIPQCCQGGEIIVNTSRGFRSLSSSSLGLKLLWVSGNYYNLVIGDLSRDLVWLRWLDIEQRNLWSLNSLKNLRVLELRERLGGEHYLEELWETNSNRVADFSVLKIPKISRVNWMPWAFEKDSCERQLEELPRHITNQASLTELYVSNIENLREVPWNIGQLSKLQKISIGSCYGDKKIAGLEHCRALERLRVHTRWEEAGIQSLERMERLMHVDLRAASKSGVEGCIRSMQKWPDETGIGTRAVPDAASLLNSFDFLLKIYLFGGEMVKGEVEKGLVVTGEEESYGGFQAFTGLSVGVLRSGNRGWTCDGASSATGGASM
ncbi:hypothetical protein SUGI_0961000 [Cryptomeria japonica]|nr:hypothetical protein SUGI_0961000 [Cryptomeria japonica]